MKLRHRTVVKFVTREGVLVTGELTKYDEAHFTMDPFYLILDGSITDVRGEEEIERGMTANVEFDTGRDWSTPTVDFQLFLALGYVPKVLPLEPDAYRRLCTT